MDRVDIHDIMQQQRAFFRSGQTRDVSFRIRQLNILMDAVTKNETAILEALRADLHKPTLEAYGSEVGLLHDEIRYALKHIKSWVKPKRRPIHLSQFPSTAWLYPEPYGVVLIIGPWNYPLLLVAEPLIGAIAAGNCAILKPSEIAPNTSALVARIIGENFDPRHVAVVEGGPEEALALLDQKFDYIFFTGGNEVGRVIMRAAARDLTPVTLELGGKSPCIVDADVDIDGAARRITWGKFSNAGQICISPDYVLADKRIKPALLETMGEYVRKFYGTDPQQSPDYARIVSQHHFERLRNLLPKTAQDGTVVIGGQTDAANRYIAPTIIDCVPPNGPLMQEEIFGPLLPILPYDRLDDAINFVNERPKPLALYFFSKDRGHQERILHETSSGGGCINDTMLHYATPFLPFGGVGESGMGKYHGDASFDTFSHDKGFIRKSSLLDFWLRYAPYKNHHKILKWFM